MFRLVIAQNGREGGGNRGARNSGETTTRIIRNNRSTPRAVQQTARIRTNNRTTPR